MMQFVIDSREVRGEVIRESSVFASRMSMLAGSAEGAAPSHIFDRLRATETDRPSLDSYIGDALGMWSAMWPSELTGVVSMEDGYSVTMRSGVRHDECLDDGMAEDLRRFVVASVMRDWLRSAGAGEASARWAEKMGEAASAFRRKLWYRKP